MCKIYIVGPVGSGKTTLARRLSKKYNIKMWELDTIVFDDDHGNIKRTDSEIEVLFHEIIVKKSWIIEDVGRKKFIQGIKEADIVYYISLPKITVYRRCIMRWIKQKFGRESYHYKPTIYSLIQMLKWAKKDLKNRNSKMDYIKENAKKYQIITLSDIKKLEEGSE